MIDLPLTYTSAFIFGLLGGSHCIGMCGGIMGALTMGIDANKQTDQRLLMVGSYNIGRITSYVIAGIIFGVIGSILGHSSPTVGTILRLVAGGMLIVMGLYLSGWWMGLTHIEKVGSHLWRHIQPIAQKILPVKNAPQAYLLGALWGWLPCGLVYSVLIWSASAANIQQAALIMLFFGLGTLPVMFATGLAAQTIKKWIQKPVVRSLSGALVIVFGVWTLYGNWEHLSHGDHTNGNQNHSKHMPDKKSDKSLNSSNHHQHH